MLLVSFSLNVFICKVSAFWWNPNFIFRKTVSVGPASGGSDLRDFPVLIDLVDSDLAQKARPDGGDVAFVDGTGTKLDHEIEFYDGYIGRLVAWVKVPLLSCTGLTTFYMYYGNMGAENQENGAGVWDSNFMMVLHLNEDSGVHYDSTVNGNNGTVYGGVVQGVVGQVDGAVMLDGVDDYVEVPHSDSLAGFTVGFTASAWVKLDSVTRRQSFLHKFNSTGQYGWMFEYVYEGGGQLRLLASANGVAYDWWYAFFRPAVGVWYNVAVVWQPNAVPRFYVNGQQVSTGRSGTLPRIYNNAGAPLQIGKSTYASGRNLGGIIDEARVSNTARNAGWLLACFNNQKDPSSFCTIGDEETRQEAPIISEENPPNGATNVDLNTVLSVYAKDLQGDSMKIIFKTNASGTWQDIGEYVGGDGIYSQLTTSMDSYSNTYWWSVCALSMDDSNEWTNKTYSFTTRDENTAPLLSNPSPSDGSTDVYTNPTLSISVVDIDKDLMDIVFRTNASGEWKTIGAYHNVRDGVYTQDTTAMKNLATSYYWSACASDGKTWTNKTFMFTTTNSVLIPKWSVQLVNIIPGVLIADVNGDGLEEVIHAGQEYVTCLSGIDGSIIWRTYVQGLSGWTKAQMADLNLDGTFEIILPIKNIGTDYSTNSGAGIHVLFGNNGTTYWRNTGMGGAITSSPVVADIDGDGYPTIFIGSEDVTNGLNGTGRLAAFSHDGYILWQTWVWRPCAGGLSLADTDNDGEFELYMGDRDAYMLGDGGYGKGVVSFWARNGTIRWSHPDVLCSSHCPILADVNKDGILDVIAVNMMWDAGIVVLNSIDGSAIRKTFGLGSPGHYQMSVYDIDGDGNLEILMADGEHDVTTNDIVVWDLVEWKEDARMYVGRCFYGPQIADVTGDGVMDIIACSYTGIHVFNSTYTLIDERRGLREQLNYAVTQDIDGDGYVEVVVTSTSGMVYAYDTPARRPNPRPRSEVQFYSERRLGVAEYVPPPGRPEPTVSAPSPSNGTTSVSISLPTLNFDLADYQYDPMNFTVVTVPDVGSGSAVNVGNGRFFISLSSLAYSTTYTWYVNVTDGTNWTNKTYTFATEPMPPLPVWWNISWPYRKLMSGGPAAGGSGLSDFPVLIDLTDGDLAEKAKPDGNDIAFVDADGNQLDHEIEFFDGATGRLVAWVRVPVLSSTGPTNFYMYYGNAAAESQENAAGVWDSNFAMVLHLREESGVLYDSTLNGNDGVAYGGVVQGVAGQVDGACRFDGVDDYVEVPHSDTLAGFTAGFTASAWIRLDSVTRRQSILHKFDLAPNMGWMFEYVYESGGQLRLLASSDGTTYDWWYASFRPAVGVWYNVAVVWQPNAVPKFYVNGQQVSTGRLGTLPRIYNNAGAPLQVGQSIYASGRNLGGIIDEARVSNVARSAGWLLTSFTNQKDPSSFCTVGTEESPSEGLVVLYPSPLDGAVNVPVSLSELSFYIAAVQGDLMDYMVVTVPDVGSGYGTEVGNGRYYFSVSGLEYSTTYVWCVSVTDGTNWTNKTYTFTTEPSKPVHDAPLLISSDGTNSTYANLICSNQTTYDPNGDVVTNIYNWYRNNVSLTNLLLPFDTNNSAIAKDYSGYGNNGAIERATWISKGVVGGAYEFSGNHPLGGRIVIPHSSSLDGDGTWSEITVEHWIYLTASQTGTRTVAKIPSYEIGFKTLGAANVICAGVWINGKFYSVTYNTPLARNTWYHVAFTYKSGSGLRLFINGTMVASRSLSGNIQASTGIPLYIGWFDYFRGKIDEVRIYAKSLSPQQIYQRYLETKNGSSNTSTIVSAETAPGDVWQCMVIPNDAYYDGEPKISNTLFIVD